MAEKVLSGLDNISFGVVQADLSMPATMLVKFPTYKDTANFTEADATVQEHYSDQKEEPFAVFETRGAKEIKVSTFDYSPETLQFLKGGTVVDGKWKEPVLTPHIESSVSFALTQGTPLNFPKCSIHAKFNFEMKKNGVALLEVSIKPLAPMSI